MFLSFFLIGNFYIFLKLHYINYIINDTVVLINSDKRRELRQVVAEDHLSRASQGGDARR
jgi:hypothetical protein